MINDIKTIYEAIIKRKGTTSNKLDIGYGLSYRDPNSEAEVFYVKPWDEIDTFNYWHIIYNTNVPEDKVVLGRSDNSLLLGHPDSFTIRTQRGLPEGFYYFYQEQAN